jgi:hypothetical protein
MAFCLQYNCNTRRHFMAKKLKIKLPKRVAGVKIPKSVRKGPIGNFLNSSGGQIILAQALVAAAGTFAASKTDPDSATGEVIRHPLRHAREAGRTAKREGKEQAARLSYALKEASRAFQAAMDQGAPTPEHGWSKDAVDAELEDAAAKKKSSRAAATTPH